MKVSKKLRSGSILWTAWILITILILSGCETSSQGTHQASITATQAPIAASATNTATSTTAPTNTSNAPSPTVPQAAATAPQALAQSATALATRLGASQIQKNRVPVFDHIIVILFENHGYNEVIGKSNLPNFNRLANQNVLFTNYYSVTHPSLPNYLALIGGSTFDITNDCGGCFINNASLPDLIEGSGRTWKTYQESMPSPCYTISTADYDANHDPFMYFDPIRNNASRCNQSVVPLTQLDDDLNTNRLPNFSFIMPNICDSGHNCSLTTADGWVNQIVTKLQSSPALGQNSMIFIVFDESSSDNSSCCGLPAKAGGRVAAILISPLAKTGIQDNTPLDHYSLLKTILLSWHLPDLGFTASPTTSPITVPWK